MLHILDTDTASYLIKGKGRRSKIAWRLLPRPWSAFR